MVFPPHNTKQRMFQDLHAKPSSINKFPHFQKLSQAGGGEEDASCGNKKCRWDRKVRSELVGKEEGVISSGERNGEGEKGEKENRKRG